MKKERAETNAKVEAAITEVEFNAKKALRAAVQRVRDEKVHQSEDARAAVAKAAEAAQGLEIAENTAAAHRQPRMVH